MEESDNSLSVKVYRMDTGLRIVGYAVCYLMTVLGLGLAALELTGFDLDGPRREIGPVGAALFSTLFVSIGVIGAYTTNITRLVLTPKGVEYHTFGFSIIERWSGVEAIGPADYARGQKQQSLLLRGPALRLHNPLGRLLRVHQPDDAIPLEQFGSAKYGELSRDLRLFAPHLFQADGAAEHGGSSARESGPAEG